jgi:peptidoglycan/xylan/chitin deacetylase (PgdA/CDA1 family)
MKSIGLILTTSILIWACRSSPDRVKNKITPGKDSSHAVKTSVADVATILSKKEVPILCYHNIRYGSPAKLMSYTVTPAAFAAQMKILSDSGYKTILPDELYAYLVHGTQLPEKPVMITFDDTDKDHFMVGQAEMKKYGFRGVFFLMTIAINRKRYMNEDELKQLSADGHSIQAHTWDHHMVTKYQGGTWDSQLVMPKKRIEALTGKPVEYFAYPFGLWNKEAIPELKSRGYKMAFILSTKRDSTEPLYTVRRMIVPGQWTPQGMLRTMKTTFHLK